MYSCVTTDSFKTIYFQKSVSNQGLQVHSVKFKNGVCEKDKHIKNSAHDNTTLWPD